MYCQGSLQALIDTLTGRHVHVVTSYITTHIWAGLLWEALFIVQAGDSADTIAVIEKSTRTSSFSSCALVTGF